MTFTSHSSVACGTSIGAASPTGCPAQFENLANGAARLSSLRSSRRRTADEADRELDWILEETGGGCLDVGTLYYVESDDEWQAITGPGGAWSTFARRREYADVGLLGLTSHQRPLAAKWATERSETGTRRLDMLMIRYNAAHTGAEEDVFPVTSKLGLPVVTFTGLRWRDLLRATPDDPPRL